MSNDLTDIVLNQQFKTYKTNSLLTPDADKLTTTQLSKLRSLLANFIYDRYQQYLKSQEEEPRYESWRDILNEIMIKNNTLEYEGRKLQYLIVCHRSEIKLFSKQIYLFIKNDLRYRQKLVLILNKVQSTYQYVNEYIMETLEDINEIPMIIKPMRLNVIPKIINGLSDQLKLYDIQLIYTPPIKTDSLKNMIIDINKLDLQEINKGELYNNICEYLYKQTKIKFNKITLVKFTSALISLNNDGKFKINYMIDDLNSINRVIWLLIDSIRQSIVV
ncbi:unnamed protein product [Candida verbasci]|uniref:Uncharacterized protein n=1 Tax=Candida verbasci TaxID=1227364 RepID=A0A9W4TVK4_9ASCO|nr:unnamed protein product [Candida verbasci]